MDPSKRGKWPLPIRTLAQTFLRAIVRKGKNQSFSNLNPKERNLKRFFFLIFFFLKDLRWTHQREGNGPSQSERWLKHFCEPLHEKERTKVSLIWIQKRETWKVFFLNFSFYFIFLKDLQWTHQREGNGPLPILTLAQTFLRAIVRKGKDQSFSNLNPKEGNFKRFFFFELFLFFWKISNGPIKKRKMAPPNPNVGSNISASHCTKRKEPKIL